ncbi:cupin domain-containing protein [Candidatus Margulisiibacteriota bacterium]
MKKIIFTICLIFVFCNISYAGLDNTLKVEQLLKTSQTWNGKDMPGYPKGKPEITILRITIPPKTKLAMHQHPVINAGVLLSGQLTVITKDNKILNLRAGDALNEVVNTWHYGKNPGKTPAEIIVFYAGIKDKPVTVKE